MADKNNILYLFDRPTEPIFIGKGDENVSFDVPTEYLIDRYKPLASDIQTRFPSGKTIPVPKLSSIPDLSIPLGLKRDMPFSLYNTSHSKMAAKLIEILMNVKSYDELLSLSVYCRDRINPYMFTYALSVALIHRPDTRNLRLPSHSEMFPSLYMDSSVFARAREESAVVQAGSRVSCRNLHSPIEIPHDYSANNLDAEHRISYFREDIGINLHHWHWHLVYPFDGPLNIVNKNRRGELFFYMHQQIIARRKDIKINSMADKNNILYLFDRPTEPIFIGKGDENVSFDVPTEYLIDRYKPLASDIQTRFPSGKTVPVTKLSSIPDLSIPLGLKRDMPFSLFNTSHSKMAAKLIEILMNVKSYDELLSLSVYCRDRINPYMFTYALSVALIHRPDTRNLRLPSHSEMFPSLYMDSSVFARAREESAVVQAGSRTPIEIPHDYSANNLDAEHRISYFREDIGINLHHWHWHLVYPFDGPLNIVNKNRRGELFFYMHQQIIARYNMERLSNNMNRVVRLTNWDQPIAEGYFPKLDNILANRVWPPRPVNAVLQNISREVEQITFDIEDLVRWRDRIFNAIHSGFIINTAGQQVRLTETDGIDILGNLIESSILSQNPNLYGSLHNNGHNAIAYIHDPDNRFLENYGVMGDSATAMRDPIFYRWHAYIDDIFQEYKATIPSYNVQNLNFNNVTVQSVEVTATGLPRNEFATFWQQSDTDLSRGLDFLPRGSIFARFTHLQHAPFNYKIVVENNGNQRIGTVRIFLAPKFDERGLPFLFREQRKLFVELDKFSTSLKRGRNEIVRRSIESSVTIPHEITYRNQGSNRPAANSDAAPMFNFCGCGWPQNMLIAKGSPEGFQCQLFVMVSNGEIDQVANAQGDGQTCDDASSYCGILNSRYPDSRSMGYPFDRTPRDGVVTLQQFLTTNMVVQDVRIRFTNRTVAPLQNATVNRPTGASANNNQRN